jgi:hypothetical protein
MRFSYLFFILFAALISACTPEMKDGTSTDQNNIGEKLQDVSSLTTEDGQSQSQVAIYDQTVARIHQFDLHSLTLIRSLPVDNPSADHYVLYHQAGNYVVDLSMQNLTLYDYQGMAEHSLLNFAGKPKSAAFKPNLGLLVVYDDLNSVGILKINQFGRAEKSWVGGTLVTGTASIAAGDINEAGQLILAMSDNSITVVDLDQTMSSRKWIVTETFPTNLSKITWLAPVRGSTDLILVVSDQTLSLLSLSSQTIVSSFSLSSYKQLAYSKSIDPHIILKRNNEVVVAYVSGNSITTRSVYQHTGYVAKSRLDLIQDSWIMVGINNESWIWGKSDAEKYNRTVKSWRFSDLLAQYSFNLRDNSVLEIADKSLLSLFPSKLGYAVYYNMSSGTTQELKGFNIPYIP